MPDNKKQHLGEAELAYIAGIIDGEGTISFSHRTSNRDYGSYTQSRIVLIIYNTYLPLLVWIKERIGGSLHILKRGKTWKDSGSLHFGQKASIDILNLVFPYLLVKREQAIIAIAFHKTRMHKSEGFKNGVPASLIEKRNALALRLRELNKKGANAIRN